MKRDEDVYAEAVEIPVAERSAFLDRACEGDQALRARVEALLAANLFIHPRSPFASAGRTV